MSIADLAARELSLETIERCFRGAVPAVLATADVDGVPNITYLSRAHVVDDHRLALSNQFMSKTSRNLVANPRASLLLIDPVTYAEYRLALIYERTERRGSVFERLRADIDDLAALTGMQDVFRLRAADIFRVEDIVAIPQNPDAVGHGERSRERDPAADLEHVADIVQCVARSGEPSIAIDTALDALDRRLGYRHTYLLLLDETGQRLFTIASRGYSEQSLGAEVAVGEGQVGAVATRCEPITVGGLRQLAKYSRSVRRQFEESGVQAGREPQLPGLVDVDSRIAVPAMCGGQVVGVLVAESGVGVAFGAMDEHLLGIVAASVAGAIEIARDDPGSTMSPPSAPATPAASDRETASVRTDLPASVVRYFPVDGSVFVDGEYVIKGVAGRILWSLLQQYAATGRTTFTNRELRLDPALDLPGFKDNLESRLLLLRRRLDERRLPFQIVRTGRGRFQLDVAATVVLERGDESPSFGDATDSS